MRLKPDVPHYRDSRLCQARNLFRHIRAALYFHGVRAASYEAYAVVEQPVEIVVRACEWQVCNNQRVRLCAGDGGGVVRHVVDCNGDCVLVSENGVADRIANQNYVDIGGVGERGERRVVGCQHRDFLDAFFLQNCLGCLFHLRLKMLSFSMALPTALPTAPFVDVRTSNRLFDGCETVPETLNSGPV